MMTAEQFAALARLMRLRSTSAACAGLRLVLVDGVGCDEAAVATGALRQNILKMVGRAREVIDDARILAEPEGKPHRSK